MRETPRNVLFDTVLPGQRYGVMHFKRGLAIVGAALLAPSAASLDYLQP